MRSVLVSLKFVVAWVGRLLNAILEWRVGKPVSVRVLIMIGLAFLPTFHAVRQFDRQHGFTKLIDFGREFADCSLPRLQALSPARVTRWGSDGQFYVQIALDPSLRDPGLPAACDEAEYRARRILLPVLAWTLGLGQPAAVVTAYALLNLAFWYLLLIVLAQSQKAETIRQWLCLGVIMWTNGVLVSTSRSFTDLPAATLMVIAAVAPLRFKPAALALSVLTKETYAICSWSVLVDGARAGWRWRKILGQLCVILAPLAGWMVYVHSCFHSHPESLTDYSWPMHGWWHAIVGTGEFRDGFAAISLLAQLFYVILHRKFDSPFWRMAITFGLAATFLSAQPFGEQSSFTRDLIPLTIGFNVLLMGERRLFIPWLVLGNAGLFFTCMKMIGAVTSYFR